MGIGISFSIHYGPTPAERKLMEDWIKILVAFVNDDPSYSYGTTSVQDVKVATSNGTIEIQKDGRWDELLKIGEIFSGAAR